MPAVQPHPLVVRVSVLVPALSLALLTGCLLDLNPWASDRHKPHVVFSTPAAWRCDRQKSLVRTAEGRTEPCTVCTNIARTTQAVSINKTEHMVPAQGRVTMCDTSAFVTEE